MFNPLTKSLTANVDARTRQTTDLARSFDDLNQAFQLTYSSYYQAGLLVDNPSGLRLTAYHLLPSSEVLVAKLGPTVYATLSLFGDGELGLPMQSMYRQEIDSLRKQGLRLAEVGSLADRRVPTTRFIETFTQLGRLIAQVASARNIDGLVAVVHPKHARFYKRGLGFQQMGDHTECPYANGNPAEALYLRFDQLSPEIEDRFFGNPIAPERLAPFRWDFHTCNYFRNILECDTKIADAIGMEGFYNGRARRSQAPRT